MKIVSCPDVPIHAASDSLLPCLVLPQTFVQHHPGECAPLLDSLLRPDSHCPASRLAEHFTPAAAEPESYVSLYHTVSRAGRERADLARILLDRVGIGRLAG